MNDSIELIDVKEVRSAKRKSVFFGVLVVMLVGGFLFFSEGKDENPLAALSGDVLLPSAPQLETGPVFKDPEFRSSPDHKAVLDEYDRRKIEEADNAGKSVVVSPRLENTHVTAPSQRKQEGAEERVRVPPVQREERRIAGSEVDASIEAVIGSLAGREMRIWKLSNEKTAKSDGTASAVESAASVGLTDSADEEILVSAGDIIYGIVSVGANSDVPGAVAIDLIDDRLGEARAVGASVAEGRYLRIDLALLAIKGDQARQIKAIVIDNKTQSAAVRSDYSGRYMERYFLPGVASFFGGFGQAIGQGNSSTTVTNGTGISVENRDLRLGEEALVGVGTAAQTLSEDLRAVGANIQPLIELKSGTEVGVLFLEDVRK